MKRKGRRKGRTVLGRSLGVDSIFALISLVSIPPLGMMMLGVDSVLYRFLAPIPPESMMIFRFHFVNRWGFFFSIPSESIVFFDFFGKNGNLFWFVMIGGLLSSSPIWFRFEQLISYQLFCEATLAAFSA